nr:MAG: hypothetical protein 2 [Guangxi cysto-like virus 5]
MSNQDTNKTLAPEAKSGEIAKKAVKADSAVAKALMGGEQPLVRIGSDLRHVDLTLISVVAAELREADTLTADFCSWLEHAIAPSLVYASPRGENQSLPNAYTQALRAPAFGKANLGPNASLAAKIVKLVSAAEQKRVVNTARPAMPLVAAKLPEELRDIDWIKPGHMPGLHVIAGGWGSGKTEFVMEVLKPDVVIRYGEPAEYHDNSENVFTYSASSADAVVALSLLLGSSNLTIAIDSLREFVFGLTGAAGSGGVSMSLYSLVTTLSNLYARAGICVAGVLNPMMAEDKATLVYNALTSSASGVSVIANGRETFTSYRGVSARVVTDGDATATKEFDTDVSSSSVALLPAESRAIPAQGLDDSRLDLALPGSSSHEDDAEDLEVYRRTGASLNINFNSGE